MPVIRNDMFDEPPGGAQLSRYMNLAKFMQLLQAATLWFAATDQLGDPWEASLGPKGRMLPPQLRHFIKWSRSWTFVSCWYEADCESAAMWSRYGADGVMIRSSSAALKTVLDKSSREIHLGRVRYIDYAHDQVDYSNTFSPFLHKRRSFAHECEVRAVFTDFPRAG